MVLPSGHGGDPAHCEPTRIHVSRTGVFPSSTLNICADQVANVLAPEESGCRREPTYLPASPGSATALPSPPLPLLGVTAQKYAKPTAKKKGTKGFYQMLYSNNKSRHHRAEGKERNRDSKRQRREERPRADRLTEEQRLGAEEARTREVEARERKEEAKLRGKEIGRVRALRCRQERELQEQQREREKAAEKERWNSTTLWDR